MISFSSLLALVLSSSAWASQNFYEPKRQYFLERSLASHINNAPLRNTHESIATIVKPKATAKRTPRIRGKAITRHPPQPPNITVLAPANMAGLDTRVWNQSSFTCDSSWYAEYAAMHARAAQILNSVPSEEWSRSLLEKEGLRVFIYIAREGMWQGIRSGGAADRFSLVSFFAMALTHNTAFFIDYPSLSDAFVSGIGGLSWKVNATGYINKHGYKKTVLHFPDMWGGPKIFVENNVAKGTLTIARTCHGKLTFMFNEKYYEKMLQQLNLKYETSYGCLFDYLFQPSDRLKTEFAQDKQVMDAPDTIKILLQIRAGNTATAKQNNMNYFNETVLPLVKIFTDCATAMEQKIKSVEENANKSIVWYLMGDSSMTRDYVQKTFGDKVFCHKSHIQDLSTETYSSSSFVEVLGEQWMGSRADYFVVSQDSGLGRQAAYRSKRLQGRVVSLPCFNPSHCTVVTDLMAFGREFSQI